MSNANCPFCGSEPTPELKGAGGTRWPGYACGTNLRSGLGVCWAGRRCSQVKESLEREYTKAIRAEYPDAEIEFEDSTDTHCLVVKDSGLDDPSEIHFNIQRITETVFETGIFWI